MIALESLSSTRRPAVAGSFYPRGARELADTVEGLLSKATKLQESGLVGIVVPHAGYMFSGPVAASAFAALASSERAFERVLLIGPAHYVPVFGIAASSSRSFTTPLGEIVVDTDQVAALLDAGLIDIDDRAHAPEHALEVELPFLQQTLGRFTLIPLLVGEVSPEEVAAIIALVLDKRTLLVVSTDLSHYLDYVSAQTRDLASAKIIERLDYLRLGPKNACGFAALNGALCAACQRDWQIHRLDLRNSGDISGNRDRVVGYGAWTFSASTPRAI
jgi:MEMO1 family protein